MYRGLQAAAAAGVGGNAPAYRPAQNDSMDVEFAELSDVGRVRQGNEDCLGHAAPAAMESAGTILEKWRRIRRLKAC